VEGTGVTADVGPAALRRVFVPEIHDVHPGMAPLLDRLMGLVPEAGRDRVAFLVVPNWQGRHPLDRDPAFAARLRALPGERVLHGWTHSLGPEFWNRLLYGHDNRSEFRALSRAEAEERLSKGLALWAAAWGERPRWFCAPRWQQGAPVEEALRRLGFEAWMRMERLVGRGGVAAEIPALNFDEGDRAWRNRAGILLRRGTIRRHLATGRPFRFVLHPDDLSRPAVVAQIEAVRRGLEDGGWRAMSADEFLRAAA
jgi:predicted deacetylase